MKSTTSVTKLIGKYSFRRVRYSFFIPHQYQHEHWTLPASCTADKLTTWRGREGKCPAVGASSEEERAQRGCVQGPEFLLLGSPVSQQVTHGVPSRSEQRHRLAGRHCLQMSIFLPLYGKLERGEQVFPRTSMCDVFQRGNWSYSS